jgi:hypothetical protein
MNSKILAVYTLVFAMFFQTLVAQNTDESKVKPYKLPEVLKTVAGKKTASVKDWENIRRPEILKLFENNVYGQVPQDFEKISFEIKNEDKNAMNGAATLKEVAITVLRKQKTVTINLLLFTPNRIKKEVPVFLVINHRGIRTMDVTRVNKNDFWPVEEVIEAGYGMAGFDVRDVAPDDKTNFQKGVMELYPEQLEMNNGMRALSAWSWGASRAIDYFEKDSSVDAKKIITVGHSRGGKASLWCGAQDKRVSIAISNDSGNSGAALSRRNFGESVKNILGFAHWFCPNYKQYAENEDKLPVDQHMLLALMAPRGVYVASAAEDFWADPKGQYVSLLEAQAAYNLYDIKLNFPKEMPEVNKQVIQSHAGFHNREGKHNMNLFDWQQFIKFANVYYTQ